LTYAEVRGHVSVFSIGACGIADAKRTVSIKQTGAGEKAAPIEVGICATRTSAYANEVNIINVIIG
jgi:hypothetical protein